MQLVLYRRTGHSLMWVRVYLDDSNFRSAKPRHRDFMASQCRLVEVVPFKSTPELLNLVVFTYRLEYIRDCILFPYLNDNGFGSSGCVHPMSCRSWEPTIRRSSIIYSTQREDSSSILSTTSCESKSYRHSSCSESYFGLPVFIMYVSIYEDARDIPAYSWKRYLWDLRQESQGVPAAWEPPK